MICYLVRHGKDDDTVRGGWSQAGLTDVGIDQVERLAQYISENQSVLQINHIYSSDLKRAAETSKIISNKINIPIEFLPQFRETNNGIFAGMKNEIALEKYPNLFWNTLEWEECYPNGESPKLFYERIYSAWSDFTTNVRQRNKNIMLITHGGVIHVIYHIINNLKYSNKDNHERINHAELIPFTIS